MDIVHMPRYKMVEGKRGKYYSFGVKYIKYNIIYIFFLGFY